MELQQNEVCNHTEDERSFITFSTTMEIKLALKQGYKILKIFEVWQWDLKSNDLFKDSMRAFLKIKLENSAIEKNMKRIIENPR